ncbi:hypothetical protein GCM10022200_15770 [Microbacterium awajiense]|uniref:Uncharacterized protein n=1 Tax=Microbacterium awajiense TaxID=415214 RepID=A0ABP7AJE5_9MICO
MTDPPDDDTIPVRIGPVADRTQRSTRRATGVADAGGAAAAGSAQIDTAPVDVHPTATMPASRSLDAGEDTIVARDPAVSRAADATPEAATGRREAQEGGTPQRIYRPRAGEPVVVARTPPRPRAPQAAADTAGVEAEERRLGLRRVIWLALGAAGIVLAGAATVVLLAVAG